MNREAGILLPISALPSKYGIGCFSKEAYEFVDLLAGSGQKVWQILPLCPTSYGDSPYQSPCSFAGNPYFLSPEILKDKGLLTEDECNSYDCDRGNSRVDYGMLYESRISLLRLAYQRFLENERSGSYSAFLMQSSTWLYDYALFMAIKEHLGGAPLSSWDISLRKREPRVLEEYREKLAYNIDFWIFVQYEFSLQWKAIKSYANEKGIKIIGDLPIYVSADSCEVWSFPYLFELKDDLSPISVAGCPPDGFSPKGQIWGNPLYLWESHRKDGFSWWISRIAHSFTMYDIVRIDHFRGFESYYSIPYGADDGSKGHWEKGPGMSLFSAVKRSLGEKQIIAEDLGHITDGVKRLVNDCGYLGMKIIQFGFDSCDYSSEYIPCNYTEKSVVYTGTHDNPTLYEWLSSLSEEREAMLREYLLDTTSTQSTLSEKVIALTMQSSAELCIIPLQDYLKTGKEGRLNIPSSPNGNWTWRVEKERLNHETVQKIKMLTKIGNRL